MAKTARTEATREGLRFHWLILQLLRNGVTGAELSRVTGVKESHINAFKNLHTSGRTGIGAEIVRFMAKGLSLRTDYFFKEYGRKMPKVDSAGNPWVPSCKVCKDLGLLEEDDYKLYLFADAQERAEQKRLRELEKELAELRAGRAELDELKGIVATLGRQVAELGATPDGKTGGKRRVAKF